MVAVIKLASSMRLHHVTRYSSTVTAAVEAAIVAAVVAAEAKWLTDGEHADRLAPSVFVSDEVIDM